MYSNLLQVISNATREVPCDSRMPHRTAFTTLNASSSTGQITDPATESSAFKILFLGNRFVGKSSLVNKLNDQLRAEGNNFGVERVSVGLPNSVTLPDFVPGNTYRDGRTILRKSFPEAHGVVLVYDVSNRQSYDALKQWYNKIQLQTGKYFFKIVIGNKVDVNKEYRQVKIIEGQHFASQIGWAFLEVSARQSIHIRDVTSLIIAAMRTMKLNITRPDNGIACETPLGKASIFYRLTRRIRKGAGGSRPSVVFGDLLPADYIVAPDSPTNSPASSYVDASACSVHSGFEDVSFEDIDAEVAAESLEASGQQVEDNNDTDLETATEQIRIKLNERLENEEQKQILQHQKGPSAQLLLDLFHMLLDHPGTDSALRSHLMVTTKYLCYCSNLYPHKLILKDITCEERKIYTGGFGDIRKGWFQNQEICLKCIKVYTNYDNDRFLRLFSKEAILWSHVSHPNILPFYGIFRYPDLNNQICLVSPWMQNGNINEYLKARPDVDRYPLIYEISEGVKYLHENNIIHGDLKGRNILINSYGKACIGDFGLSTIENGLGLSDQWTSGNGSPCAAAGTLRWQAPELLDSDSPHVTKMSDVYAFGCVCYEILTGETPFYDIHRDPPLILHIVNGGRPSRPEGKGILDGLWKLMKLCWGQEPSGRPVMEEVVENLCVCYSVEQQEESWGTLSSSSIRLAMHGPMKYMTAQELRDVLSWL